MLILELKGLKELGSNRGTYEVLFLKMPEVA